MILGETMTDLLRDWHHWGFEIIAAIAEFVVIGLIGTPLFRRWLKNHDAKKHAHQHCDDVHDGPYDWAEDEICDHDWFASGTVLRCYHCNELKDYEDE